MNRWDSTFARKLFPLCRVLCDWSPTRSLPFVQIDPTPQINKSAIMFSAWIDDHLKPHAATLNVAHPLMLRAIAAAKKKSDRTDRAFKMDGGGRPSLPTSPSFLKGRQICRA